MDKRTILAIVLSGAILIIYYAFLYKPSEPPAPITSSTAVTPAPGTPVPERPVAPSPMEAPPKEAVTEIKKAPTVLTPVEKPLIRTELTSDSGLPLNWWLLEFFKEPDKKGPNENLLIGTATELPMGLLLYPGQTPLYPRYEVKEAGPDSVTYEAQAGNFQLEQILSFGEQDYAMEVLLRVKNLSEAPQTLAPGIRVSTQQAPKKRKGFLDFQPQGDLVHPVYMMGNSVEREQKVEKLGAYSEQIGDISWVGVEDRYFLRAVLARSTSAQNKAAYGVKGDRVYADFRYAPVTLPGGGQGEYQFTVYLGPKDPTYLNQFAGAQLGKAIDLGWFAIVAQPILLTMKFFNGFLHNWGLAIILLTILIKILLYPLTKKSMGSMKAMQKLQPQLKEIREKYKEDRERLNAETMNLFKRHKVNPMGGCLPMLLQMPIYIALYKVLYNATELYHAPFFWFYRDLSAPDPYYVMPILLGIFMVLQQKLTPTTGDPSQAKMMMIMPVLFSVFMLFLPVGLVLYIFVNTVMTVIQQFMHQRDITILGLLKGKKISL